ncbi:E3 ubiquitin-protein ligase CCNB1IP1-like protein, partial [Zea mays]
MKCNACWRDLEGQAVSTTCGHLLCADDARKILNNDGTCPICDQVLSKSHMKPMDINPGDDWRNKRIYLPGNPQVPGFIPTEKPTTFDSCAPLIATHPLEMNPFAMVNREPYPLDIRGELDDTTAFKNFKKWGGIEFPLPFGRVLSPTESFIHELDE